MNSSSIMNFASVHKNLLVGSGVVDLSCGIIAVALICEQAVMIVFN